jgi:hypothetical protein
MALTLGISLALNLIPGGEGADEFLVDVASPAGDFASVETAAEGEGEFANLASEARTEHFLEGHMPPGEPGNTLFPGNWSAEQVMHNASDIATDPSLQWRQLTGRAGAEFHSGG